MFRESRKDRYSKNQREKKVARKKDSQKHPWVCNCQYKQTKALKEHNPKKSFVNACSFSCYCTF